MFMEYDDRPSPEDILQAIKQDEVSKSRGRLKIFLGMAAGVGKTYSMLEEAHVLQKEGVSVVVGIVDTHGREETGALLEGLKVLSPKTIVYREREFKELDLDEILRTKPHVVIIDELAHSNVPGVRHAKRWEDVIEILEHGIDVHSTLNVQHIESLNDVVEGITGFSVRETVPDSIIEKAAFIQLVDITPDELLQRLKEGKVYLGNQSQIAAVNFFQKDRLTALREIVLRYAAEKVDHELHHLVASAEKSNLWRAREKLLVAVSHSPYSQRLIRTARRIAFHLDAPWVAVYVNDGRFLSEEDNNQLAKNLSLARDLGAEVITTNDPDITDGLKRIARQKGITQIIVGRPPKKSILNIFQGANLIEKLAVACSDIDLHIIRQERNNVFRRKLHLLKRKFKVLPYLLVFLWVLLLTCISWMILSLIGYKVVGVIFLLGILSLSLFFKKGPIFFGSILYALSWRFIFIPPMERRGVYLNEDIGILILYFLTGIVTGVLVDRGREYKEMLAKREESAQSLYEILRLIVSSPSKNEMFKSVKERLEKHVNGKFEIVIKKLDNGLDFDQEKPLLKDEKEKSIAQWVFDNGKEAGWSTSTLPFAKNLYIPLKGFQENVGVLAYRPKVQRILNTEEKNFLYTVSQQLASYLERTFSEEKARQTENVKQVEKIYHTVLKSISSEFQHPLSAMRDAIFEAFQALKYDQSVKPKAPVTPQIHKIETSSSGLFRMLDNVSVMAKLSSGFIPINKREWDVETLISHSVGKINHLLGERKINIKIHENLPKINCDNDLIEIVILNLLRNAIDYSPSNSTIIIEAQQVNGSIGFSFLDEGPGIPPEMLDKIFTEFYRVPGTSSPGMGLGLSICKRIAEIHNGFLTAENRPEGGTKLTLFLPI